MIQKISQRVTVGLISDSKTGRVYPQTILWQGRVYKVKKLGLHHTYKEGSNLLHVFSVLAGTVFLRLILDSSSLLWKLDEISDGLPE